MEKYDSYIAVAVNVEHDKGNRYKIIPVGVEECYNCIFEEKVFSSNRELYPVTYLVSDFPEHIDKGIKKYYLFPIKKENLLSDMGKYPGVELIEYFRKVMEYDYHALVGIEQNTFLATPSKDNKKVYSPIYFDPDKSFFDMLDKQKIEIATKPKNKVINRKETIEKLKQRIIAQDDQVERLVTSVLSNQKYASYKGLKNNIIIVGTTGTGKTEMCRSLSEILDIPFVKVDATKYASTGYVGNNVLDILGDLYLAADRDLEKTEKGIIFIDEIDKLCRPVDSHNRVRTVDVQHELLGLLGNTTYDITVSKEQVTIDTSKITFILAGAFHNIFDKYANDMKHSIGFSFESDETVDKKIEITRSDLIKNGVESELLRRIPILIQMNTLTKDDLKKIATESKISNLRIWQDALFREDNITLVYRPKTIDNIASEAEKLCGGASGLQNVISKSLEDIIGKAIDGELSDSIVVMQEDIVNDSSKYLVKRLETENKNGKLSESDGWNN